MLESIVSFDLQDKLKTSNIHSTREALRQFPGPGWGPVRVGARSGLGPLWAHKGPYGPNFENVTFRVQTAPFDKITTDFWRSRRRLYIPDLLKAKKSGVRSTFF